MAKQQKIKISLPKWLSEDQIEEAAGDIRQMIIDRSQAGQGIRENGRRYRFPEYSEEYRKNVKGGQRRVDLTLSEEMLEEIQTLAIKGHDITLGFEAGTEVNAKAEGNQIGSYGRAPNPAKARRFLDINKEELDAVLAKYK